MWTFNDDAGRTNTSDWPPAARGPSVWDLWVRALGWFKLEAFCTVNHEPRIENLFGAKILRYFMSNVKFRQTYFHGDLRLKFTFHIRQYVPSYNFGPFYFELYREGVLFYNLIFPSDMINIFVSSMKNIRDKKSQN